MTREDVDLSIIDVVDLRRPQKGALGLPAAARERLEKCRIDLSGGYPNLSSRPLYPDDLHQMRDLNARLECEFIDTGTRADPERKGLLFAPKGTGLQIAERSVACFHDRDIARQEQKMIGVRYGEIEVHPQDAQVPGTPAVSVMWPALLATVIAASFRPGVTYLHNDTVPSVGSDPLGQRIRRVGEALPCVPRIIDGRTDIYRFVNPYLGRDNPEAGLSIEREHVLVRVHLVTDRIVGLDKAESDLIPAYLHDTPKITIQNASWNYKSPEPRHGTLVTALAEKPFFGPKTKSRREALSLLGKDEIEALRD
ncbi:hypothetical protein BDW66DRAFT_167917 [Aspergillus desertorum]